MAKFRVTVFSVRPIGGEVSLLQNSLIAENFPRAAGGRERASADRMSVAADARRRRGTSSSKRFVLEPRALGRDENGPALRLVGQLRSPRSRQEASDAVARPHNPARSDAAGGSPFRLAQTAAAPGRRRSSRPPPATPVPPLPPVSDCPGASTAPAQTSPRSSRALTPR